MTRHYLRSRGARPGRLPASAGTAFAVLLANAVLIAETANAEVDCEAPCVSYLISGEFRDDWSFLLSEGRSSSHHLDPVIEAEIAAAFTDTLSLVTAVAIEPVVDREPGDPLTVDQIGAGVSQLYLRYATDTFSLRIGKFEPGFSLAAEALDGIHATDLAAEAELTGRLGGEVRYAFEAAGLSHALTASLFTIDRSFLAGTLGAGRQRPTLADGGAGNTDGFSSAALTLDGCVGAVAGDCYEEGLYGYRLGILYELAGAQTAEQLAEDIVPADELGLLAAATARFNVDGGVLRLLGEAVYFRNFEGEPLDAVIATVAAELERGPLTTSASYSLKHTSGGDDSGIDHLVDVGATYRLDEAMSLAGERWSVGAGYSYALASDGTDDHRVGLRVKFDFDGIFGGKAKPSGEAPESGAGASQGEQDTPSGETEEEAEDGEG